MARLPCQPQKRLTASSAWRCRGFRPRSRGANARMWSGVVPQQPPRMAAPMSRNVLPHRANSSGPTSKTVSPPSRRGRPALGWIMTGRSVTASMASRAPASSAGPREQLMPTTSAPRLVSVTAAQAGSVPRKVRPSSPKVMVTNTGRSVCSFAARRAALASSRSLIVSIRTRSAPAAAPARTISVNWP